MNNILYNNAYGILGLLANATQKEITKRVKNIEKLVYIDEIPKYDYDFSLYNNLRSLENIKQASQDLSDAKKHILHYFFRLYVNNDKNEEILKSIETNFSYNNIFELYNSSGSKNLIFKKNIAITLTLGLISNKVYSSLDIEKIIYIWKDLLSDEKYAKDFQRLYMLDDELGIDESLFDDLNDRIQEALLDIFSDISKSVNDVSILAQFINIFDLSNEDLTLSQVEDCYKEIDKYISVLKEMNISEDGVFDNDEKAIVKNCLSIFQIELNKLKDLNLYDNVKTILLRDTIATTIRLQIIDIFNNLDEDETALKLMKFAIYIVGTKSLKLKLEEELDTIKSITNNAKYYNKIEEIYNTLESMLSYDFVNFNKEFKNIKIIHSTIINAKNIDNEQKIKCCNNLAYSLKDLALICNNKYKNYKRALIFINLSMKYAADDETYQELYNDYQIINKNYEDKIYNNYTCIGLYGLVLYVIYKILKMLFTSICEGTKFLYKKTIGRLHEQ